MTTVAECPITEAARILGALPIFARLPEETVRAAAERAVLKSYPRNAILFRMGESCHGLYSLGSGRVQIYRASPDGREQTLHFIEPGMPLAEVPVFDGGPYPASARAVEGSRLAFIPLDRFRDLYHAHAEVADAVIIDLGRRLRRMVGLIDRISLHDVGARVALALSEQAERTTGLQDGTEFDMPWTQSELATELATTRESVARALSRLRKAGVIEGGADTVRILDTTRLRHFAAGTGPR